MKAVPGILPTLLEMICFFSTPTIDVEPFFLHELHHARDDHRRRHRAQHGAHHRRFDAGDAQNSRCKQEKGQNFAAGRHAGHHHRRAAHLFQVGKVERQARLDKDDDQCHLPQVGRDGQDGRVQPVQYIWPQQNACEQHSDDAGQMQLLTQRRHGQPDEKNKCKRCEHKFLRFCAERQIKKPVPPAICKNHRSHQL